MGGHGRDERRNSRQADYEDETAGMAASTHMCMGNQACTSYMEDLIPKFSGQDKTHSVAQWAQDVEDNAEIFKWSPLQTLIMARRALRGTAALWLKSERPFKSWENLKAGLLKEFPDTIDSKAVHEMMSKRHKRKDERCLDYMLAMKEMGKRGKMPDYVAIKYIIDGIIDVETNKIMLYGATTYAELKERIKIYETIKEKVAKSSYSRSDIKSIKHAGRRCYNCGENNHTSAECPNKGKGAKCFKCNQFGHIAAHCKQTSLGEKEIARDRNKRTMWVTDFTPNDNRKVGYTDRCHERSTNESDSCDKMAVHLGTNDRTNFTDVYFEKSTRTPDSDKIVKDNLQNAFKTITVNNCRVDTLIDSGCEVNLMSSELYAHIGEPGSVKTTMRLIGLGGSEVMSTTKFSISIKVDGHDYLVMFFVIPRVNLPCNIILGQDFLKDVFAIMSKGSILISPSADSWLGQFRCFQVCQDQFVLGNVQSQEVRQEVIQCVQQYNPIQTKEAPIELRIVLKDDIPVAQRPRRISLAEQVIVENQVSEWLKDGIIRVSFSEYSSPLVLVRKKDGGTRICIDYRPINKKIIKDEFPLPIIDDLIDRLKGARVFSVLDLKNGFFHLKVSEDSIKYTAFVTHNGQYEFLRAPFGLSVCPKYFMRFVTIIFQELITKGVLIIFIDDLLIPASDELQAVERLKEVLAVASQYGLQINWKKAQLLCRRIEYLGHIVEDGQVQPSKEKTEAVTRYPEPKSLKQLHSFVGLTSYFRKYIKDYALIAKPLTDLLKKGINFQFNDIQRDSFMKLKSALAASPVLRIYDPELHTEMHTDASAVAYSAILFQKDYKGELHPIHYFSRKTNDAEKKYSSYELEALAIIEGVKKFRHYLYGKTFKIVTDCQAFQKTLHKKDLTTRVARWVLLLEEYNYVIEHRPGSKMQHTDALSRNPYIGYVELSLCDQIKRAQVLDEGIKAIIEILKIQSYEDYAYSDGLLYKGLERRLVIPKSLEVEILKRVHEKGHFGKRKMIEVIQKDYYIKNIGKKIEEFLLTCIPCLLATKKEGKQEGFLNYIDKESIPLHTIHCDHIGPLTETRKLYNYILTVVDGFTKFVWLFPVKGTTSKETIDKLKILQQIFGNPIRLISDRGTAFTSKEFKEYCDMENIQHITITTGVPRGNGQVERIHRIMIAVLTKLCIADPTLWYKHVSRMQTALNSTYQRSIDTTPFELLVGTKMKTKEDIEIYNLLQQEQRINFMQEREDLKIKAKEQIRKVQEENCKTYNKRRKDSRKYIVGDIVAIKRTQFGTGLKLKPKYLGPYTVIKVKGYDRYEVRKLDPMTEGSRITYASADNMKPWPETADDNELGE